MGGVFMKKMIALFTLAAFVCGALYVGGLIADRKRLEQELVRLHVVGASDSEHDQNVKLHVRDAVVQALDGKLDAVTDAQEAKAYIRAHLDEIEQVANDALAALGEAKQATVSFLKEAFPVREYDTFRLPSGVYDALRIVIGEGEGKNWWCVVFPKLCYASVPVKDVTAGAGFSDELSDTVTGERQIRFFLLDVVGKVQNFFRRG